MTADEAKRQPGRDAALSARRRWMDIVSSVLLVMAVSALIIVTTPAVLRARGIGVPTAGPSRGLPSRHPSVRPEALFEGDEELEPGPGRPGPASPHGSGESSMRLGEATKKLTLRPEPDEAGAVIAEIDAGELVMILKEHGDYVLVVRDGSTMGWARKSGISVR